MEKKFALKMFFYYGAILDGIMGFLMIYSLFASPPAIIPYSIPTNEFRFAMGWAAVFMVAWTILLIWASLKPVGRKDILPLTLYIVVLGLAVVSASVGLITICLFQVFGIILPGSFIFIWAKDAKE
jgi:hypothetical protein